MEVLSALVRVVLPVKGTRVDGREPATDPEVQVRHGQSVNRVNFEGVHVGSEFAEHSDPQLVQAVALHGGLHRRA